MLKIQNQAAPVGRLLIAAIFVISGWGKITGFAGTQAYMEAMGVPGALLPVVIALEIVGGIAIIIGWQTRIAALALAGFTLLAGLLFHGDTGDQMQMIMLLKNVAIAGGLLLLFAFGPGAYALDGRKS